MRQNMIQVKGDERKKQKWRQYQTKYVYIYRRSRNTDDAV